MRTLLLRRLAPVLALIAVVGAACSSVESPAATINGSEISVDSLRDDLKAVRSSDPYRDALEQTYQVELAGEGTGTFSAAFTGQVLSIRVYVQLLEQALADQGVEPTDEDLDAAREVVEEQLAALGDDVFDSFPEAYQDRLVRQEAVIKLAADEASKDVEVACVSHILITTESRTEEEARGLIADLEAQLDAGADFAEVAAASSEDPGSAAQGGSLGCNPAGTFVPEFDAAAFSLPVGEVSEPVQTDFGFHLVLVESRETGGEAAGQAGQAALSAFVGEVVCGDDVDVDVNPKYGRWDRDACDQGGLAAVTPPRASQSSP